MKCLVQYHNKSVKTKLKLVTNFKIQKKASINIFMILKYHMIPKSTNFQKYPFPGRYCTNIRTYAEA